MNTRTPPAERHRALKSLFRTLVERVGGLDAAAACCRVGRSQIASYYDMSCDQFAPVDVIADLERVAGEPVVTRELARVAGAQLAALPEPARPCPHRVMADLAAEAGELWRGFASATADGRISGEERPELQRAAGALAEAAEKAFVAFGPTRAGGER